MNNYCKIVKEDAIVLIMLLFSGCGVKKNAGGGTRCKISIRKNGAERCYSDRLWALFTSVRMGKK